MSYRAVGCIILCLYCMRWQSDLYLLVTSVQLAKLVGIATTSILAGSQLTLVARQTCSLVETATDQNGHTKPNRGICSSLHGIVCKYGLLIISIATDQRPPMVWYVCLVYSIDAAYSSGMVRVHGPYTHSQIHCMIVLYTVCERSVLKEGTWSK